eukprot:412003_1
MAIEPNDIPSNYYCGTVRLTHRYVSSDNCGQSSEAEQIFYILPEGPEFTSLPSFSPQNAISTSVENIDPVSLDNSWPDASGGCNDIYPINLDAEDRTPLALPDFCGLWSVDRAWTASLNFGKDFSLKCSKAGLPVFPAVEATQTFYMKDDEPPRFVQVGLKELHVPFFDNFNSTMSNSPIIDDIASNF